jgi:hypothetical protein
MPGREYFLWQVRFFTVRLALDVVAKLARQLADRRLNPAEEHGGLLFGRVIGTDTVEVTSFEFIRSEHHRGVLYDPGGRERARIAQYVKSFDKRKGAKPIGYFRTHLRPGLFLDQADFALMVESFSEIPAIALAIRPDASGPSNAGIFFWEDDDIDRKQTQLMFPFDAAMLRTQGPIIREMPAAATTSKAWVSRSKAWISRLKASPAALLWGAAAVVMTALTMAAVFLGDQAPQAGRVSDRSGVPGRTQIAGSRPTPLAPIQPELQPGTNAPPAVFQDGLDAAGPGVGNPEPAGPDAARPSPWHAPVRVSTASPKSKPESSPPAPPPAEIQPDLRPVPAAPAPETAPNTSGTTAVPLPPPPEPVSAPAPKERSVTVDVVLEYKEPGGLKKIAGHIPLLGHLQPFRNENGFSPPRPTASLKPRVPAGVTSTLSEELAVDVVVSIDKDGAVKNTEITKGAGTEFATLAASAAGSVPWEPARSGDRGVPTNVVLHYRFNPSQ